MGFAIAGTPVAIAAGVLTTAGAQAARVAPAVVSPATLRKSRREKFFVVMISSEFGWVRLD
jgi:hypothetical protein